MIENFNLDSFTALVYCYAAKQNIITPKSWEQIICDSFEANLIPGDYYMADGYKDSYGMNIKSTKRKISSRNTQTIDLIQCRCPIQNEHTFSDVELGEKIIQTLVDKRDASFNKFNLSSMLDVDIIHTRCGDDYHTRLFIQEQPKYENINFEWKNGVAIEDGKTSWKIKRNFGDSSAYQTCIYIKKIYDVNDCIADIVINSPSNGHITVEDAKKEYQKQQRRECAND